MAPAASEDVLGGQEWGAGCRGTAVERHVGRAGGGPGCSPYVIRRKGRDCRGGSREPSQASVLLQGRRDGCSV